MRKWTILVVAVLMAIVVGCTSDVRPAVRDDAKPGPIADSGYILPTTTGGDAAGTVNLDVNHQGEAPENAAPTRRFGGRRRG